MKRANVLGAALVVAGLVATAVPAAAQTVGADLGLFSSYVWRGLSLTNKPVAQPDLYVTFPAGAASITLGGWANIDLGKYDDPNDDISESGGSSAFNFAEFDPWAEISYTVGKATLTGGVTAYIYPNKDTAPLFALTAISTRSRSTARWRSTRRSVPKIAAWYDVDKIKGSVCRGQHLPLGPAGRRTSSRSRSEPWPDSTRDRTPTSTPASRKRISSISRTMASPTSTCPPAFRSLRGRSRSRRRSTSSLTETTP